MTFDLPRYKSIPHWPRCVACGERFHRPSENTQRFCHQCRVEHSSDEVSFDEKLQIGFSMLGGGQISGPIADCWRR